jgi:hypothetical protein
MIVYMLTNEQPIQRVCKYSLLFREINQFTPAIDCPESNRLLEKVRQRFDETAHQVNRANRDAAKIRERLEKTTILQERLSFPGEVCISILSPFSRRQY